MTAVQRGVGLRGWAAVFLLAALVSVVFWPVRHHPFIDLDDTAYVLHNRHVLGGLTWANVTWAFTSMSLNNWHPLTWISHMMDVHLFALDAGKHHLVNLALHAASTVALFLLLRGLTGDRWRSWMVAALFGVHPLHVESVAWVAERKDVLSGLFWMLGMAGYGWYVRRGGLWRYCAVAVLFAVGLTAKPMLVTLPLVFLLLDWWPLGRLGGRASPAGGPARSVPLLEKLPLLLMAAGSGVITYLAQREGGARDLIEGYSLWFRIANAVRSYALYLVKTFWPTQLSIYYPFPDVRALTWEVVGSGVLLAVLTVLVVLLRRNKPHLVIGWIWYLVTLVPVIGLLRTGGQAMADRYTYLPLTGLFVALVWSVRGPSATTRRAAFTVAAAGLVVGALSAKARQQVGLWRSSADLFSHAATVTTGNWMAHFILGDLLVDQGRVEEAIRHYSEAARIHPTNGAIRSELGMALEKVGRRSEGLAQLELAVRLDPNNAEAHNNLGAVLYSSGRVSESLDHFREALRRKPDFAAAQRNYRLASMYLLGRGELDRKSAQQ